MDIDYLKQKNIIIKGDSISINNNDSTIHIKNDKMYVVFSSGEIVELDKIYKVSIDKVSGKNSVGVILD